MSTAGARRDLVRAAAGPNPVPAVVRTLASAVEGWAAQLAPDGEVLEVWPRTRRASARQVEGEVARLRVAGPHSSATFPIDGDDVVLQPLTSRGRLSGFVATGCPRPMRAPDRQLVLSAGALLALQSEQQRRAAASAREARACVARLLMAGYVDAARALAADLGLPAPAPRVRVLALAGLATRAGGGTDDALDTLEQALPRDRRQLLAVAEADEVWALVAPGDTAAVRRRAERFLAPRQPYQVRGILSEEITPAGLHQRLPALRRAVTGVPAGALHDLTAIQAPGAAAALSLKPLLEYARADLIGSVAAYLRHRGNWERAAADLGVHRNTLRHRISTATRLVDADLDDPDVASHLWLALRESGLA